MPPTVALTMAEFPSLKAVKSTFMGMVREKGAFEDASRLGTP